VVDHDHAPPGEHSGERHGAGQGRVDGLADVTEQVDTAVAGAVRRVRWVEPLDDLQLGSQRLLAAWLLHRLGDWSGRAPGRLDGIFTAVASAVPCQIAPREWTVVY
jgi:hypothetical protein